MRRARGLLGIVLLSALSFQGCTEAPPPTPAPIPVEPTPEPVVRQVTVAQSVVGKGDTFGKLAQEQGIPWELQKQLIEASREILDLERELRPGDRLQFELAEGSEPAELIRVSAQRKRDRRMVITPTAEGPWTAELEEPAYDVVETVVTGTIESSLWDAARDAGLDPATLADLIKVFDWQVDFFAVHPGDRFRVVLEGRYLGGSFRGFGDILGARFQRGEREAFAIRFTPPEARPGFYDLEGGSNKRLFLASAVDFSRISSSFNPGRYHPILKKRRAHRGTDYAAGRGTPVRSIGDGTVIFVGTKGGYGKHVRIRHKRPYESSYSHLSSYNVKTGQQISQGDTLGKVGSTGLATGPHLHFEFYMSGKQVDWEKQEFPAAEPLEEHVLPLYFPVRDAMKAKLVDGGFPLAGG